jgi:integrase
MAFRTFHDGDTASLLFGKRRRNKYPLSFQEHALACCAHAYRFATFDRRGHVGTLTYLTDEEEKSLFAILVGRRAHIRPIVVVALQTGMRQGEILGLKWENVDFEQNTIYVAHTKTGRPRKLPNTVGPYHFADDFSVQSCHAEEPAYGG